MSEASVSGGFLLTLKDGIRLVQFNRPTKKNAISLEMYEELTNLLNTDASNDTVRLTILTGVGEYYSSGNDLSGGGDLSDDMEKSVEIRTKIVERFVAAFINYPKLLIAVVNGPAIGIAVTSLALCDVVYASNRATFATPFVNLGFCPEGCSSFLFPRVMGRSKATEMLLLGRKLTASEAHDFGLVSKVIPHENLGEFMQSLEQYKELPPNSLRRSKELIVGNLRSALHDINVRELAMLKECLLSGEFFEAISKFMARKSKL